MDAELSIDAHVDVRCKELARSLAPRKAIYLDFRFWVNVREVLDGVRYHPDDRKLVHHLTRLARTGRIFCPISAATFSELMKIGRPDRRRATAQAIEELSAGVSLMPEEDRIEVEVEDLVFSSMASNSSRPPRRVWTRLAYVLGNISVEDTGFPLEAELNIQKAFFDHLWEQPLSAIAEGLYPEKFDGQSVMAALADRLNAGNRAHAAQMKSFENILSDEMGGVAELAAPAFQRASAKAYRLATGRSDVTDRASDHITLNLLRACLAGPHGHRLPTLHVHGSLHALFRWEYRDKLLTANDIFDFMHAAAALAYCDAFFTEKELVRSISHHRIGLDKRYGCFVTNKTADALSYLKSLH